jgi:hypothetical protein
MAKKYIGWGRTGTKDGQKLIVVIPAKSKKVACEKFERLGMPILSEKHVRHLCIVKYPGTPDVKKLKTINWNKGIKPIEQALQEKPK